MENYIYIEFARYITLEHMTKGRNELEIHSHSFYFRSITLDYGLC